MASAAATRRRLGVFDSGVGGLTVVASLRRRLPGVELVYLGDTARLPYGTKSAATVARYTRRNVTFLLARGVDGVVVACNSASAMALSTLEASAPVWGVIEPGAAAAAARSAGRVGVIATEATVRSRAYPRALEKLRPELAVLAQPCPLLVPLVEEGWLDDEITERVIRRYLAPLLEWGMDTLVLGCTHYPLLEATLRRVVGPEVALVDSAGRRSRTSCSFSATICRSTKISVPQANSTHTMLIPIPEADRTRRTFVAPFMADSMGIVTSVSTSSGARPWASVMMVTVGRLRSGKTSIGSCAAW